MTNAYVVSEQDQWQEDTRLFHAHVVGVLVNVHRFRIVESKTTIPNIPPPVLRSSCGLYMCTYNGVCT